MSKTSPKDSCKLKYNISAPNSQVNKYQCWNVNEVTTSAMQRYCVLPVSSNSYSVIFMWYSWQEHYLWIIRSRWNWQMAGWRHRKKHGRNHEQLTHGQMKSSISRNVLFKKRRTFVQFQFKKLTILQFKHQKFLLQWKYS